MTEAPQGAAPSCREGAASALYAAGPCPGDAPPRYSAASVEGEDVWWRICAFIAQDRAAVLVYEYRRLSCGACRRGGLLAHRTRKCYVRCMTRAQPTHGAQGPESGLASIRACLENERSRSKRMARSWPRCAFLKKNTTSALDILTISWYTIVAA